MAHRAWLTKEFERLLGFGRQVGVAGGGAAWLDERGRPVPEAGVHTWITARMAHTYCLGALLDVPGSAAIAGTVLRGLTGPLRDRRYGGWHAGLEADGRPRPAADKSCYDHAFVLLAASSAAQLGWPDAGALLEDAVEVFTERFLDERTGLVVDTWDGTFSQLSGYRGLNAMMHTVEAMLAVADAVGVAEAIVWRERALRIARFVVQLARRHDGRLPEHFDRDWNPLPEFNRERPTDRFKPFGVTPGHGLEWSRLLLAVEAATGPGDGDLRETAVLLFERAVSDGWAVDGEDGFVYTTDWSGRPVVRNRLRWVIAEAIAAAAALDRALGDQRYAAWYATWWEFAERHLIDRTLGSWHHELDPANRPVALVGRGKPDLYHAVQATLLPRLPSHPSIARALRDGLLA